MPPPRPEAADLLLVSLSPYVGIHTYDMLVPHGASDPVLPPHVRRARWDSAAARAAAYASHRTAAAGPSLVH